MIAQLARWQHEQAQLAVGGDGRRARVAEARAPVERGELAEELAGDKLADDGRR